VSCVLQKMEMMKGGVQNRENTGLAQGNVTVTVIGRPKLNLQREQGDLWEPLALRADPGTIEV
jgi:hypothetical protein